MRLLHGRHGDHRVDADRRPAAPTCPQQLKGNLCRCTGYRAITDALSRRGQHREVRTAPASGRSLGAPAGAAGRDRRPSSTRIDFAAAGPAAPGRAAAARMPHARIVVDRHHRRRGHRRRAAVLTHRDSPPVRVLDRPPREPARRPRRHPRARRHRALRRAAGRRRRRRHRRRSPRRPAGAIDVEYEVLPAVFDPEAARRPGAPLLHGDKGADARIADAVAQRRRRVARRRRRRRPRRCATRPPRCVRGTGGSTAARPARAPGDPRRTGWRDDDGRLGDPHQLAGAVPGPRRAVPRVRPATATQVRVFTARVGGGFGGKQEMLTEDLVALAVLRTRPPGAATSSPATDEFTAAPCRHPMRVDVDRRRRRRRRADRAWPSTC